MDLSDVNERIVESIRAGDIPAFRRAVVEWLSETATPAEIDEILEGRELIELQQV